MDPLFHSAALNSWCSGFPSVLILFFNLFSLISFQTTAPCATIAGFCCHLVVTMRPIPKNKLEGLVRASCSPGSKGHPIHIGDPGECPLSFSILTATPELQHEKTGTCYVPELPRLVLIFPGGPGRPGRGSDSRSSFRAGFTEAPQV